jgi:hypothetical protein
LSATLSRAGIRDGLFMMQPTKHWFGAHGMQLSTAMPRRRFRDEGVHSVDVDHSIIAANTIVNSAGGALPGTTPWIGL